MIYSTWGGMFFVDLFKNFPFFSGLLLCSLDPPEPLSASSQQQRLFTRPPSPPKDAEPVYTPYTDDPEAGYEPGTMLQTQRQLMEGTWGEPLSIHPRRKKTPLLI